MKLSIRQAVEKDCEAMNALFGELDEYHREALPQVFKKPDGPPRTRDFLAGVLADPNAVILVAEAGDRIVGLVYAYVRQSPDSTVRIPRRAGEVDQIVVKREYRRHGVGEALMARIHQWAGEMELDRLELSVWDFNRQARDFYRGLDYQAAFVRMWKDGPFPD